MADMDLPARVTVIEGVVSELRDQQKAIVAELKHISTVLTGQVAQRGPSFMDMLNVGARVLTAFVVTVTAASTVIIFLARGVSSSDYNLVSSRLQDEYHSLEKRLIMLEARIAVLGK